MAPESVSTADHPAPRPMRVLVVDDDELDRLAVRRYLQQSNIDATVDDAASAPEALRRVTPDAYDCILLDYYIPGVDTVALFRQLHAAAPATPVIVFTGHGYEELAVEFMKAGAVDYLPKASLTADRLAASFRYALEISRAAAARRRAEAQLRDQEARFRTLANAIPQLVWIADAEGAIHWYNRRWYDYTGTTLEEMQGWGWTKVHHPDHVDRVVERIRRSFELGEAWEDTFPLRGADGQYRWFLSRALPMRNADGDLAGWFGTNTDITERVQHEAALREREEALRGREAEFRTLANAVPQLAWIADTDGLRYWFNARWYEYTGLRPDQALGLGWRLVHHPDHRARSCDGQLAAFKRGETWEDTVCLRRADGEFRWFLSRAMPVKDEHGRILRWIGTDTDISERREAERAVAASEERLRRALEIETVGVIFFNTDGRITGANSAFLRMGGYTRDDVDLGRVRWDTLTPAEFMPQSLRALEEFKAAGRTTPYEKQYIRNDGSRWWAVFAATRLDETEGVEFVLDITEKKEVELARERALDRERVARTEAEHAVKAREEVLSVLSHDLRNPMHTILAAASMLALTAQDKKQQRPVEIIQRATQGMERLVTDLLDMARIDAGVFAVRKEPLDVAALIRQLVELFEPQALARQIELRADLHEGIQPVPADRDRLVQVLSNLLGNALKFTPASRTVIVRAAPCDDGVEISVKDSGAGIRKEDLSRIFDRFWQAERVDRAGAGLGLAISKAIVEAHGGRIWAASKVGRGTTFYFQLPSSGSGRPA